MDMVSYEPRVECDSAGTKALKVCHENIPYMIILLLPTWTADGKQDGSMLSFCLCQILIPPSDAEIETHQTRQTFIIQFQWTCLNCSFSFWSLADKGGTWCGRLLLQLYFRVLHSEINFCILLKEWIVIWITVALLSAGSSMAILQQKPENCYCPFLDSFWNTPTSTPGTKNCAVFKITTKLFFAIVVLSLNYSRCIWPYLRSTMH